MSQVRECAEGRRKCAARAPVLSARRVRSTPRALRTTHGTPPGPECAERPVSRKSGLQMNRACSVCQHSKLDEINVALARERSGPRSAASRKGSGPTHD
jgi:hypothetical protein